MTLKRVLDIVGSIAGLLVFMPLMLFIAIWIKLDSPGPVLFRQIRVGRRAIPFLICKFRSMTNDVAARGPSITAIDDPRVTRAGSFLRRHKLDELPQLWNVLVGEMSLVGPRPEVPEFIELYSEREKNIVLSVRPGITDLASLEFRNESELIGRSADARRSYVELILPRKIEIYERYVMERSLAMDLRIIFETIRVLLPLGGERKTAGGSR